MEGSVAVGCVEGCKLLVGGGEAQLLLCWRKVGRGKRCAQSQRGTGKVV